MTFHPCSPFRILRALLFVILAACGIASLGNCTTVVPVVAPLTAKEIARQVDTSTPDKAEEAFFIAVKRAKQHDDAIAAGDPQHVYAAAAIADFRKAAREAWTGIQEWRAGGSRERFHDGWIDMLIYLQELEATTKK